MSVRFPYDIDTDPPAPVIVVRVSAPREGHAVMVPMLVDTGADGTLLPISVVRRLGLPQIDVVGLSGVAGTKKRATVHAAILELADMRVLARIVAYADEAIVGRDLLNQAIITLDGPRLALLVQTRSRRSARST